MADVWVKVNPEDVVSVWRCQCFPENHVTVDVAFFPDCGTPVCEECGDDMDMIAVEANTSAILRHMENYKNA